MGVGAHGTNTVALPCRHRSAQAGVPGRAGVGGGGKAAWRESTTVPNLYRARGAIAPFTSALSTLAPQPTNSGTLPRFCRARGLDFGYLSPLNIMSPRIHLGALTCAIVVASRLVTQSAPPEDFPRFRVPGHEKEMATLRELFWLHYPGAGPKATLWDEWLPDASLWPAVATDKKSDAMRTAWATTLKGRVLDAEGYVATHQHASIAHQLGWPFPFWNQGRRGFGWHFSFKNTAGPGWRPNDLSKPEGWTLTGARDAGVNEDGWQIEITNAAAIITAPPWKCHTFEVPFIQLRWQASGLGEVQPFIEWATPSRARFSATRRMYFEPVQGDRISYTMIPMYRHPRWTGEVTQLRIGLGVTEYLFSLHLAT